MTEQEKRLCVVKTDGTVSSFKNKGLDFPNLVTVNYAVNGKTYVLEESVSLRNEPIKLFGLTIGQRKTCVIDVAIGSTVNVCYNPHNPHYAYLLDNVGRFNV